jgi:hypothetical protein
MRLICCKHAPPAVSVTKEMLPDPTHSNLPTKREVTVLVADVVTDDVIVSVTVEVGVDVLDEVTVDVADEETV